MFTASQGSHNALQIVSAIATELDDQVWKSDFAIAMALKASRFPVSLPQLKWAANQTVRTYSVANQLQSKDDALMAYTLAVAVLDETHPAASVYLDDLAEWLALSPAEYRPIRENLTSSLYPLRNAIALGTETWPAKPGTPSPASSTDRHPAKTVQPAL